MRGLLVERLLPLVVVAFGAGFILNLTLVIAALAVLQWRDRVSILSVIVLIAALLVYTADRLRGSVLASAARTVDRDLVPAAIANSLEALRDIRLLRSFLGSPGMLAVFDMPWSVLYLIAIVWIHPLLGFAALAGVVLLIAGLSMLAGLQRSRRTDSLLRAARVAEDDAEGLVRSAETLLAMGMSHTAIAAWRERHEPFVSHRQHADRRAAQLGSVARAASLALQVALLALGAWLVTESRLSIAPMMAATLLFVRAMQAWEHLAANWHAISAARGAWLRLHRRATSIVVTGTLTPIPSGRIELERVCYAGVGRPASIKNVTLHLEPGESILIAGSSGCGKTTLARLLLGVLKPQSGTVRLDGADLMRWDRMALGECVGYVSQDIHLFPGSIADNIARMGAVDSTRVVQAARLAHAHEMIVRMPEGYHTHVSEAGACLAAVQRRRIALARALYTNPRLVVLDEPNADMDAEGELALIKTLAELKERGVTVVIVGQRTSLLEHVDRMAVLRDGTLQVVERRELQPYSTPAVVSLPRPTTQPL